MATGPSITVHGNLTAPPELRFTAEGTAFATMTVASTPRYYDRTTREWKDGNALFLRCHAWRALAVNAAESLDRGSRVIVTGRLTQRNYQTRDGDNRTTVELDLDDIGSSLLMATATLTRTSGRTTGPGGPTSVGADHQAD
ncbi:single-stranded DNA-binding protein [Nocardia sp. NPDC057227]|uniref:single-stranded DNA-binding protein n=1 Tax=Nocardia sp. NPDC057227 TaxID=3346056 RepID=UPI00363AE78D